ncbi:MAG: ATP-binding protein [Desulfuromonadales bacterium]|nr:ATP-binding protein [Desulfuromonadales bacterium]
MGIDRKKSLSSPLDATEDELRHRAEQRLSTLITEAGRPQPENEAQSLLHELQVHQIELEMQNTELRQARDDLEKTLEKYTDLYDFAPVGYFTLARDGAIHAVNLRGAGLLGLERTPLNGRHFEQFVTIADRPVFTAFLSTVFESQVKVVCELELLKEDEGPLFVQIEAVTVASRQECLVTIHDITERRLLEDNLEILHAEVVARATELECANIELDAFNYSIAHDLRRPLTVIHGYCQALMELCSDKPDAQCKKITQKMYEGFQRMNQMIDALLKFSSVTRVEMHQETVDLSAIANAVAEELKLVDPENLSTFRIVTGITAEGDPDLLRIVLNNLIDNAWKYAGSLEEVDIEFGVTDADGKPACFVRDNGQGFDMALADKLFLPFQRLSGTNVEGHGIGLATVERIVRRHGGRIWAESKPGEGATFFFTLA